MTNNQRNETQSLDKTSKVEETETTSRKILTHEYLSEASNQNQKVKITDQQANLLTLDFSPQNAKRGEPELLLTNPAETRNLLLIGEINSNGQTIREIFIDKSTGRNREFVVARNNGIEHRIEDKRITKIPFDSDQDMQPWRQKQIEDRASGIIEQFNKASTSDTTRNSTENIHLFGGTLNRISKMEDLTEQEKAFLWDNVMSRQETDYKIGWRSSDEDKSSEAEPFDLNLAFLKNGFHDFYHIQLANLAPEAASRRVQIQETNKMNGLAQYIDTSTSNREADSVEASNDRSNFTNTEERIAANIKASESQIAALREYKAHGFSGYAEEWNKRFVDFDKLAIV